MPSAVATILLGAGSYGVAFGIWRAPRQALYSAVKLPVLFLSVALLTVGLGSMLAMLLRSKLSLKQTGVCMLLSFAVTAAVLGSLAPVAIALDLLVPQRAVGVGRALLLFHTATVAAAGAAGVVRLRALLARLELEDAVARRVLVSWITAQFLVGSQVSWLLRPFFGDPHAPTTFFATDVLRGNFFETVLMLTRSTFGDAAPVAFALAVSGFTVMLWTTLRAEPNDVAIELGPGGLVVSGEHSGSGARQGQGSAPRVVEWHEIAAVRCEGMRVKIDLALDEALVRETLRVPCASREAASHLARQITDARARVPAGPFRTATAASDNA